MQNIRRDDLTPEIVRELLEYSPDTGELRWKVREIKWFRNSHRRNNWNAKWAGKTAFTTVNPSGYHCGSILEVRVLAQRVAWAILCGEWPQGTIDHINGVKTDNRAINLRDVSHQENLRNTPRRCTNKSGVVGVFWTARSRKWRAYICVRSRLTHLGYFDNFDEAVAARKAAEAQYDYHPNHGRENASAA